MVKGMSIVQLETKFKNEFNKAVAEYANTNAWDSVASIGKEIPSNGSVEDYRWLQEMPEFELWLGDLNSKDLAEYRYTLANEEFATSIGVHKNEIDDDKDDLIRDRIRSMAGGETRKWGKLLHTLLVNGTTNLAFDGIAFFSNASGVRLNDNLLAGTISAATPTIAQVLADVDTVMQSMGSFVDSRGEIIGIIPDTFVVSLKAATTFRRALLSPTDGSSTNSAVPNPFQGIPLRVIVDPGLTDLNDFYALATTYSVGPLIKQRRSNLEMFLDDTQVNVNRKMKFGGSFRGNVGYGLPILAAKVVSAIA